MRMRMRRWVGFDEMGKWTRGGEVVIWVCIWERSIDMGHRHRTSLQ